MLGREQADPLIDLLRDLGGEADARLVDQAQSEKSVTAIAFEWGFNSSAHFSRLFKSQVGVAPTSYRRNLSADAPGKPGGRAGFVA